MSLDHEHHQAHADDPDEQHARFERMEHLTEYIYHRRTQGLTRRDFLKYGLSLGLALPAVSAVLTGCGFGEQPQQIAAGPTPTATAVPTNTPLPTNTPRPPTATPAPTATPEPSPTPVVPVIFGVIGDFGWAGPEAQAVADMVKSWNPAFIITTGDNNYPSGAAATIDRNIGQYYHEFIGNYVGEYGPGSLVNRFWPTIGNHDTDVEEGQAYFDYFTLPGNKRYYSVDLEHMRMFALNSVAWYEPDGVYADSVQSQWLRTELAKTSDRWKVVVFHHPPYSSDYRGSNSWMRWPYKEWGADIVLCGHNHAYERLEIDGMTYLVNGLGGGARYGNGEFVPGTQIYYWEMNGAQRGEVTPQRLSFEFFNRDGVLIDTCVLERNA